MLALYKTRFRIRPTVEESPDDTAGRCSEFITDWLRDRLDEPELVLESVDELDRGSLLPQVRRQSLESGSLLHSFFWKKPGETDGPSFWVTTIDVVSDGERLEFQLQLGVEENALGLQSEKPKAARPNLIPTLISCPRWDCLIGDQKLSVEPSRFSVLEAEQFCDDILFDPEREIPIVVMTTKSGRGWFPVKPLVLAERLGGIAKVYTVDTLSDVGFLDRFLGRSLAIGPFAIRVFGPGLEPGASLEEHWHFLGETIEARQHRDRSFRFTDFLFGMLAGRALPRFRESPLIPKFRRLAAEERRRKLEALRAEHREDETFYEHYAKNLEKEIESLKSEHSDLELEVLRREEQIEKLEKELTGARQSIHELSAKLKKPVLENAQPAKTAEPPPQTVIQIVEQARNSMADLEILDSALSSAERMPPNFEFPDRVEQALEVLQKGAEARNQANGRMPQGWKDYFRKQGLELKAKLSDRTRQTWGHEYTFRYEGKDEIFEEHFTIGRKSKNTCITLHFSTRVRTDKIVVAYVGPHLRNTQT